MISGKCFRLDILMLSIWTRSNFKSYLMLRTFLRALLVHCLLTASVILQFCYDKKPRRIMPQHNTKKSIAAIKPFRNNGKKDIMSFRTQQETRRKWKLAKKMAWLTHIFIIIHWMVCYDCLIHACRVHTTTTKATTT